MATITGKPKQLGPDNNPYMIRTPFVHPSDYKPGMDASRWRLIASEPVNKMARRMIQREVGSLNWIIRQTDNESEQQRAAAAYYSEVLADFRHLASRVLKGVCELPQGGAWEVAWMPAKFGEARGTLAFIDFIDAGTLHPTTDKRRPIVQIDPTNTLRRAYFNNSQIVRVLANPRDEFDREWWQESPTEANYLQIEALARLYTFSLKKLLDTPPVGILDLMDFSADSAKKWADSFRETIEGIDPIKIPVLYEHEKAANYISLANDFNSLDVGEQFKRFAELVLANYGLSVDDLRIFDHAGSKAGMAVSQKTTVRSGIMFFAELIKDAVQSVLPDFLVFEYSEPDVDEERSKAQVRAADARTLQTLPWLPVRHRVELAKRWNLLGDLDIDPEEIEKEAEEAAEKLMQAGAPGSQSPSGAGGTNVPKPRPGQLERGEGRNPDLLEDESKRQAARGARIFAKAEELVDGAADRIRHYYPKGDERYGKKLNVAAEKFETLLTDQFTTVGSQVTVAIVQQLLDMVYTQFPLAVQQVNTEQPTVKGWIEMVDQFLDGDYVEKQEGEQRAGIQALIEQALEEATFYSLSEEAFLVRLMEILTLAYEDGLLGISEAVQARLFSQGKVKSPAVNLTYRLVDPNVIRILGEFAADLVQNVDSGTKFYLRRMIVSGALEGLSADVLTDRIQADLFILPEQEAAKLPASRIRSIVNTELNRADSLGRLAEMKALGLKLKRWVTRKVDVCVVCIRNEAHGAVDIDFVYESVFRLQNFETQGTPAHPRTCHCHIAMVGEELDQLSGTINYWTGGTDRPEKAEFEKFDPDPEREPAGTSKVDSTGGGAGGQFAPKDGESSADSKTVAGVKKHMSPSGTAISEGRTTAKQLSQREFVGLFDPSEYGTDTPERPNVPAMDTFHVFKEFGEDSPQHRFAKQLDTRINSVKRALTAQFRQALADNFSAELSKVTIETQTIRSSNAPNVWKLLRGEIDKPSDVTSKAEFEKFDPNPNRWPADTGHVDSTGGGSGGQFRPKNGGSTQNGKKTVSTSEKKPPGALVLEETRETRLKVIEDEQRKEQQDIAREQIAASKFKETDAATYLRERAKTEFASMLTPFTEKELAASGKKIYELDGVFYMIDNGDLQGVVNVSGRRGAGQEAIIDGIVRGGKTLDAFGGFLDGYYARFGFVETERLEFNPEFAPDNWDSERFDSPDVVFMEYPEGLSRDPEAIRKRFESAGERTKSEAGRPDRQDGAGRRGILSRFAREFDRATRRKMGTEVSGLREGADRLHAEPDLVTKHDPSPRRNAVGQFTFKPQTKRRGKNTAGDLFYMVRFRDTHAIDRLADYAREHVDAKGVKWEPQDNYHTTLVFLPDVPAHMVDPLTSVLDDIPSIPLETDRFGTFSTDRGDESNVLFLKVRRTDELVALFNRIYVQAIITGVKISEFSHPDTWKPHITLAYADEPFDESKLPEIGGVGLGSLQVDATVDRKKVDQSPPIEDTFEPVAEKFDPDPNREPAGTTKTDSTGGGAGGQFAPKNGDQADGSADDVFAQLAKERASLSVEARIRSGISENGPNDKTHTPHTESDIYFDVNQESMLDYDLPMRFRFPDQWTEEEMESMRYYYDALHSSTLFETQSGNRLPENVDQALQQAELDFIGLEVERGSIIASDGTLVKTFAGSRSRIEVDDTDLPLFRGNYFTHAHPVERPLSPSDMSMALGYDIKEVRAVSPTATYRWSFNDIPHERDHWNNRVRQELDLADMVIYTMGGKLSSQKTAVEMMKTQHAILTRLAEEFDATYTREPHVS